jgi:hypothetical protein
LLKRIHRRERVAPAFALRHVRRCGLVHVMPFVAPCLKPRWRGPSPRGRRHAHVPGRPG